MATKNSSFSRARVTKWLSGSETLGLKQRQSSPLCIGATHHTQILGIIDSCREYGVDFKLVPDLFEMRFNEVRIDALNDVPLMCGREMPAFDEKEPGHFAACFHSDQVARA